MIETLLTVLVVLLCCGLVYAVAAARVVKQYERGVVFRLGRLRREVRQPGFTMIVPGVDRLRKVNMQIVTLPVPAQEGITRDNVTVRVDAVVYFKVVAPADAVVAVEDYRFAVSQMAQTSLRSIIGKSDLDDLLSNREKLNQGLELMIDSPAVGWGVHIDRVEIKDVSLPETMKRSMARQAEADRERRARVINADAEFQASKKLADAASEMSRQPAALQLRLLQTVVAVAAEKNSTLVLPFPVELLRFLERAQQPSATPPADTTGRPATEQPASQHSATERPAAEPAATESPAPAGAPSAERAPARAGALAGVTARREAGGTLASTARTRTQGAPARAGDEAGPGAVPSRDERRDDGR
ncbi:SPFH domain-containing protein [Streptomyces sp. 71268]|uniref:slipin family protein n=1 Tax=Streptomyces sp. 71268 TaxID=3002640 RepID=UPI0023F7121E|nr:SPFH domain-containing protein [Streptomyces sp. 71268]WEV28574.1 SPFH domain-containing protein [Streptomyces sp. 71268]